MGRYYNKTGFLCLKRQVSCPKLIVNIIYLEIKKSGFCIKPDLK